MYWQWKERKDFTKEEGINIIQLKIYRRERIGDVPWELFASIFPWLFFGETRKYQIFFVESLVNIKYFLCWIRKWLIPVFVVWVASFNPPVLSRNWLSKLTGIIAKSYFLDQSSAMLILNQSGIIQGVGDIKYWARLLTILYLWQPGSIYFLNPTVIDFFFGPVCFTDLVSNNFQPKRTNFTRKVSIRLIRKCYI